jgi:DNA processing protein
VKSESRRIKTLIGENNYTRLRYSLRGDFCQNLLYDLKQKGITPVTYYCEKYPALLKNIYDPPLVLYCMGNVDLLNSRCISVVGTRKISAYGKKVTQYFVSELSK